MFCDIGAPDKIISDNARYFTSEEFQDFTLRWSIHHITSSPHFPHGNAHAEKHHVTTRQQGAKWPDVSNSATPVPQQQQQHSYNLQPRKH